MNSIEKKGYQLYVLPRASFYDWSPVVEKMPWSDGTQMQSAYGSVGSLWVEVWLDDSTKANVEKVLKHEVKLAH